MDGPGAANLPPRQGAAAGLRPSDTAAWALRPFGTAASDLDLELRGGDRAASALLAACVRDPRGAAPGEDVVEGWTINRRLSLLVALRRAAGDGAMTLHARCSGCGEAMAIELELAMLDAAPADERFVWRRGDGTEWTLRLPTARDLKRWRDAGGCSPVAIAASLVERVGDAPAPSTIDATDLVALDEAFASHDPLSTLTLRTSCPHCGRDLSLDCDLEALLVADFAHRQAALLDEVLRLAAALHWSERMIVALPAWRRQHYLRRLNAGVAG